MISKTARIFDLTPKTHFDAKIFLEWRKRTFGTQKRVAKALGVEQASVSLWELGKNTPNTPTITLITCLMHAQYSLWKIELLAKTRLYTCVTHPYAPECDLGHPDLDTKSWWEH